MIGILIVFIAFSVVFGEAFNFGVHKSKTAIVCDDENCSSCPTEVDNCK